MPMVIPAVVAFAAAGGTVAGVAAALTGAAGFATFATVAGGFLTSAGMLTKNKTLTKIGSVLGIAGAVTNLASSLSGAAAGAAEGAAGSAAEAVVGEAAEQGAGDLLKNELANSAVGEGIGQAAGDAAATAGGAGQLGTGQLGSFGDAAGAGASSSGSALTLDPNGLGGNLMDQYRFASQQGGLGSFSDGVGSAAGGMPVDGSDYGLNQRGLGMQSVVTDGRQATALAEAGQQFKDKSTLDAILDKLKGTGQWVKDNKELVSAGGQLVGRGLQAYQQGQQFDEQMNLIQERRRRLNQPVVLGINTPQLKIGG